MSTEDRLRGLFKAKGDEIADAVDHESIQPEQRRRPSWLVAVAAAAAVLLVIGGVGWFARSGDGPILEEATDTTTTAPATAAAAVAAGPTLNWTQAEGPEVGDGYVPVIVEVDDGFLAIAETWDEDADDPAPTQQAWHSTDGTAWTAVQLTGLEGAQVFYHSIVRGGPGFVAVGMEYEEPAGPYGPETGEFLAFTSADGLTWERHTLPQPDLTAPDPLVTWYPNIESVAVSDAGIVAAGTAHAEPMFEQIAADYLGTSLDEAMEQICGIGMSEDTLEVFSCPEGSEDGPYEEELLFSATFAELGISDETVSMMNEMSEQALVWFSPDGSSWELIDDPFGAPAFINSVAATTNGFYAVAHGPMRPALWYSADGRNWEATGTTPEDGDIDRIFADDGVLYAMGRSRQGGDSAVWSSTDGETWTAIDLAGLFAGEEGQHSIWELKVGGLGLIGQAESYVDPYVDAEPVVFEAGGLEITMWLGEGERVRIVDPATGDVLLEEGPWEYREPEPFELERDGYRLNMDLRYSTATLTDLATGEVVLEIKEPTGFGEPEGLRDEDGNFVFYDPQTDEVYLTLSWDEIDEILGLSPPYQRWDDDGIRYIDPETRAEIVTVPMEQFEAVMDEGYRASEGAYQEPNTALVFSPDGNAWSRQPVAEAFGEAGWIETMAVGDDAVFVVFRPHGEGFPTTEAEAELYEQPQAQFWLGTLDG